MTKPLNHECLNHIFQFVDPKDWIPFTKVCKTWKEAAFGRNCQKLIYDGEFSRTCNNYERLEFIQFFEILEFVAPKLKYMEITKKIHLSVRSSVRDLDVCVSFGNSVYITRVNNTNQNKTVMDVLLKQTKSIKKLKINTFLGATKLEWKEFFQKNPLNYFRFQNETYEDSQTFFDEDYISILPNSLEQVGLNSWKFPLRPIQSIKLAQFLKKLPRLTKLHLTLLNYYPSEIAEGISKHANTIEQLCLSLRKRPLKPEIRCRTLDLEYEAENAERNRILSVIPKCTNLTKLNLSGFDLRENQCRQIAANCQSIRRLKLLDSKVSEKWFKEFMSLPNLSELYMHPTKMNLTAEVKSLKKLVIIGNYPKLDFKNLATALSRIPNLSYLLLDTSVDFFTKPVARKIKRIIHSRGKNIVLYSMIDSHRGGKYYIQKVGEIVCKPASNEEFKILAYRYTSDGLERLFDILKD